MTQDTAAGQHLERIDAQRALDLLEKAVAERGEDYVYVNPDGKQAAAPPAMVSCAYIDHDGQPSCVVGHALTMHGVPAAYLSTVNRTAIDFLTAKSIESFVEDITPLRCLTVEGAAVFASAQSAQDRGATWGDALNAARSRAAAEFGVSS